MQTDNPLPTASLYDLAGGEDAVRRLTRRFYALMDTVPEARACRAIHPASLERAEEKLYEYLTGWLGGPPLFTDKYGPPMLRARHLKAPIGDEEIAGWLLCFRMALEETAVPPAVRDAIWPTIERLGHHMHNKG